MEFVKQQIKNGVDEEKIWAEVEAVAAELDGCLCRGLSEATSADFVDGVLRIRGRVPEATTFGVFRTLMEFALRFVKIDEGVAILLGETPAKPAKKTKAAKAGSRRVGGV